MSRKKKKNNKSVKLLPISIILFVILSILALYIILNKGKIAGYSLVKTDSSSESGSDSDEETKQATMEISAGQKYLSTKTKEETELTVLIDGTIVDASEVEFTSSNEDVITVEEGIAKAVSIGKATITAKKDDLTATVDLRAILPMTSMTFTATNTTIRVGKSLQMKLVITPSDASIETFKYESSDESIATVNANGIVTGVSPGNVTITVTDTYTDTSKSVKLTIRN